jgi:hypothetical protein
MPHQMMTGNQFPVQMPADTRVYMPVNAQQQYYMNPHMTPSHEPLNPPYLQYGGI